MSFKILSRRVLHEGRAFNTELVKIQLPDGREVEYNLARHRGAVVILPVDEQGRVWFVRQYRLGAEKEILELPAGVLEAGEEPIDTARREIQEEIGMAAGDVTPLGAFYLTPGYSTEHIHAFLARGLYPASRPADEDEFLKVEHYTVEEIQTMIKSGEICDGKTLAVLLLGMQYLPVSG
jgi:ADP-ribose pyrophosphatase